MEEGKACDTQVTGEWNKSSIEPILLSDKGVN